MKKILSAAALLVCAMSFGQNINPTVEVTNTYQGNPSEVHKPQIGMAIPDSLMRFDMDFNYEVFQKPYQGAYNFKPYMLAMRPDKDAYRGRQLYLKAGAGYSLHPQLDFVFSPEQSGPFQMSVYANHRSYFGKYHSLVPEPIEDATRIVNLPGGTFFGYDALTSAGFDGRYNFDKAILSFGIGYSGLMTKDTLAQRAYNAFDFNARLRSNRDDDKYIFYDFATEVRYGSESKTLSSSLPFTANYRSFDPGAKLNEVLFSLKGEAGPVLSRSQSILLGIEAETGTYSGLFDDFAGNLAFIPKYRYATGKWDLSLGVRVEKLFGGTSEEELFAQHTYRSNWLFPDVHASYMATDNVLLYASATGGNHLNTYSSLLDHHHFLQASYLAARMDNSVEKINARIGVKGNFGSKIQFELDGGASVHDNGLYDAGLYFINGPIVDGPIRGLSYLPGVGYADYSVIYADALLGLHTGSFRMDGGVHFRNMTFADDEDSSIQGLLLPRFTFDLRTAYDFTSRLYAGINVMAATSRSGFVKIPGYLDLGLTAGYKFNRKLSFWLESGNLLCETIQRNPFYAEKDLWITAGITLNL
ncbi:MAG: TonB-dependent receptor [Bacteroidales bacterium]|nr:TonB-dependent receptor [Bacteroidales bacterium]